VDACRQCLHADGPSRADTRERVSRPEGEDVDVRHADERVRGGGVRAVLPDAPVVAACLATLALDSPQGEEGQQPHGERDLLAPHVLRATDQMLAREQAPADVEVPHQVDHDGRDGLARKEERAAEPESCAGQDDGHVTEVKKVGPAPDRGVSGDPPQARQGVPAEGPSRLISVASGNDPVAGTRLRKLRSRPDLCPMTLKS